MNDVSLWTAQPEALLRCCERTVLRMCERGLLRPARLGIGRQQKISLAGERRSVGITEAVEELEETNMSRKGKRVLEREVTVFPETPLT